VLYFTHESHSSSSPGLMSDSSSHLKLK